MISVKTMFHRPRLLHCGRVQDASKSLCVSTFIRRLWLRNAGTTCGVQTVCGTMDFGRLVDETQSLAMVKLSMENGCYEFDTASMYADGKSEEIMGTMDVLRDPKVIIASKVNPALSKQGLKYNSVISEWNSSLDRLQRNSVDIFYLHMPDHNTPIEETLRAVNQLHKEGKFKEFGLSNYASWQVAEICGICSKNDYILPTVYQGMYNALTRAVEKELFPCIRNFGLRFYAYNPLAGGILAGKLRYDDKHKQQALGRFFEFGGWSKMYQGRFWHKPLFDTVDQLSGKLDEVYGRGAVSVTEASLRWLYHHSLLNGEYGDKVILGASKLEHLDKNFKASKQDALHEDIVKIFDEGWTNIKGLCPDYNR